MILMGLSFQSVSFSSAITIKCVSDFNSTTAILCECLLMVCTYQQWLADVSLLLDIIDGEFLPQTSAHDVG